MQFKNSHRNFFLECLTCGVSSLTLSYLSLKVIAPLDKIVFYVERQFDKFVYSFEVNFFFRRWSFFASACFFNLLFSCAKLLHSFFTLRYLRVYFLCVVFPFWSQSCKFSGKVFKCFTSISFVYFGVIQILFERLIFCKTCCQYWRKNKIRWKRKHCDFPVLTKGRCPYSSCHIYWPTVESTFDLVLTLLIGHRCLIIEFCFKVLYSCNSL